MTRMAAEDFTTAARVHNINWWPVRNCSICGVPVGFYLHHGLVAFKSACACSDFDDMRERSWQDVADHYNRQDHPDVISRYDHFWRFDTANAET